MTSDLPSLLELDSLDGQRFRVRHPETSPEGRNVVFGGQILAQMIMASAKAAQGAKDVKSIHAIFARTGSYDVPMDLEVSSMHAGRSWASDTVSAWQGDRLLARALLLLNVDDPDLMRHQVDMPDVPGPAEADPAEGLAFPGSELRVVNAPDAAAPGGGPALYFWTRFPDPVESVAANQAIMSWATNGSLIGLAMRPHADVVNIADAHHTVATGVIGHTLNFHERFDVSQWLLLAHEGTYAGRGRVHGRGLVFTEEGRLVATFSQDSMAKGADAPLDARRGM